jgi:hypothetical protein
MYRGMSTAAAIEYTSLVHNDQNSNIIKFLVLDSPYASVKQVVDTVLSKFHEKVTYNLGNIYMCKYYGMLMCIHENMRFLYYICRIPVLNKQLIQSCQNSMKKSLTT